MTVMTKEELELVEMQFEKENGYSLYSEQHSACVKIEAEEYFAALKLEAPF